MKDRLEKFMLSERLTSSRLAEILGVQPSNVSHILSGRNKPSFDFIEKMLQRFPKINPDWFLLGKGNMYRSMEPLSSTVNSPVSQIPIPVSSPSDNLLFNNSVSSEPSKTDAEIFHSGEQEKRDDSKTIVSDTLQTLIMGKSKIEESEIERIVIFLKNKTFVSYSPE